MADRNYDLSEPDSVTDRLQTDIRKVNETLTSQLYILDIKDNPNISIDVTNVCSQIRAGRYKLIYDKTQDIRGCDALDIKR